MPDSDSHEVDPADEGRHRPEPDPLWNESYYLDFVADGGAIAGYARIGLYPGLGVTWWTTVLVGAERPLTASVSYDLPVADGTGLVLNSHGVEVEAVVEAPLSAMTVRGTAAAVVHADPGAVYRGEPGDPTTLGLDLAWTTDGAPYRYDLTTRYEVPCLVRGEITIDGERLAIVGQGQRDHSWGVRDWWAFGWCWAAARLDDGTRVHLADIRIPGSPVAFGYLQPGDGSVNTVEALDVSEIRGEAGMPVSARAVLEPGGLELQIEPLAFGPLLLVAPDGRTSRFPRAAARFTARDGRVGTGWIEWNQPELPMAAR